MQVLQRLAQYNNHRFQDDEDLKVNEVANKYLLVKFAWSLYTTAVLFGVYIYLLEIDFDRYYPVIYHFLAPAFIFSVFPLVAFFVRGRMKMPLLPVVADIVISQVCLAWMSVLAGQESHLYLVSLCLIAVPFFLLQSTRRRFLVLTELLILAIVAVQFVLVFGFNLHVDLPSSVFEYIQPMIASAIAIIFIQIGYIVRNAEIWHRRKMEDARQEVEAAYKKIKARDERIQNELKFAADIQHSIVQHEPVSGAPFTMFVDSIAYGRVTGDYFDIIEKDGHYYVILADASGHGIPAALLTIVARQAMRDALKEATKPGQILALINRRVNKAIQTSDYLTAFIFQFSPDGLLHFGSAGHPCPFLIRAANEKGLAPRVVELDTDGMVLGAILNPPRPYQTKKMQLQPGDRLVLYTDGITEQRNSTGEEVGSEQFKSWLKEMNAADHQMFHQHVFRTWLDFVGHDKYGDDITMMTFEYTG